MPYFFIAISCYNIPAIKRIYMQQPSNTPAITRLTALANTAHITYKEYNYTISSYSYKTPKTQRKQRAFFSTACLGPHEFKSSPCPQAVPPIKKYLTIT